jgi:hypothetical protein
MKFSAHFDRVEFEFGPKIPVDCIPVFVFMCEEILEPTREFAGPLKTTSGYRSVQSNLEAHGQPNSEHIATPEHCACDFFPIGRPPREVFDWMRQNSSLPYHQLILEHGQNGSSVIHVSVNRSLVGVRSVKEGATHNSEPYIVVDSVPYVAPGEQSV